ncbi:MAG: hypothetical protein MUF00_19260 [Gemmatimonadaceae bacterium]|nr:hypothetical protein [Gemmatimonadaceae bacterium]
MGRDPEDEVDGIALRRRIELDIDDVEAANDSQHAIVGPILERLTCRHVVCADQVILERDKRGARTHFIEARCPVRTDELIRRARDEGWNNDEPRQP